MTFLNQIIDPGLMKHVVAVSLVLFSVALGYAAIRKID